MAENKTQKTEASVEEFLNSVENDIRRRDALEVARLMENVTGDKPIIWGKSIVGFGDVQLKYESGREVDYFKVGFSPRKAALTLYLTTGVPMREDLLSKLGKHTTGKGCLYIKNLDDIDRSVLLELVEATVAANEKRGDSVS